MELCVGFGADNEEGSDRIEAVETHEVEIGAIHDVEGSRFRHQDVERLDVAEPSVGDMDEGGDIALQMKECVEFDGGFCGAEQGPGEEGEAEIDGCYPWPALRVPPPTPTPSLPGSCHSTIVDALIAWLVTLRQAQHLDVPTLGS